MGSGSMRTRVLRSTGDMGGVMSSPSLPSELLFVALRDDSVSDGVGVEGLLDTFEGSSDAAGCLRRLTTRFLRWRALWVLQRPVAAIYVDPYVECRDDNVEGLDGVAEPLSEKLCTEDVVLPTEDCVLDEVERPNVGVDVPRSPRSAAPAQALNTASRMVGVNSARVL